MTNQPSLRHCPSCGGPVTKALGLRDYESWLVKGILPGKVSASDIDFFLEQSQTGRCLAIEFKDGSKPLGLGQRIMFRGLKAKDDVDVWVAWERGDVISVGAMTDDGLVPFQQEMTRDDLALRVQEWWYAGLNP